MYFKITILLGIPPPKTFRRALLAKVSFVLSNIPRLFKAILNDYFCQGGFSFIYQNQADNEPRSGEYES